MQSAHYTDITLIKRKAVPADRFVQDVECRGEFSASVETKTPTATLSVSDTTQAGNLKRVDVTWTCSVFLLSTPSLSFSDVCFQNVGLGSTSREEPLPPLCLPHIRGCLPLLVHTGGRCSSGFVLTDPHIVPAAWPLWRPWPPACQGGSTKTHVSSSFFFNPLYPNPSLVHPPSWPLHNRCHGPSLSLWHWSWSSLCHLPLLGHHPLPPPPPHLLPLHALGGRHIYALPVGHLAP